MKKRSFKMLALLLAVAMMLSLVACKQETPKAETPAEAPGSIGETVAAESEIKLGGTVNYFIQAEPTTLDAWAVRLPNDAEPLNIIYEYLLRYNSEGGVEPFLIDSYEENPEELTYTLKLKDEPILFHDGSELTAEVVAWNLNMYKAQGVLTSSFYSSFDSAEAVDEDTVVIRMNSWDNLFIEALARTCYVVSKEAYDTKGAEYIASNPVGTGPFKFDNWEHGISVSLVKHADYWRGEPRLDGINMVIYAEYLVAQVALQTGELDVLPLSQYNIIKELEETDGITVEFSSLPSYAYTLCYMCDNPEDPLYDIRVRQAISYVVDTAMIKEVCSLGYGNETTQWCLPGSQYYNDEVTGYPYNVEKAKELLAEAGYPNGFTTRLSGVQNTLEDGAQIVVEALRSIGIECELNIVDMANFVGLIGDWQYGMFLHPMGAANGAASQMSSNLVQGLQSGLGINAFLHPDDLHNVLVEAKSASAEDAVELYQKAAYLAFEEYCMMKVLMAANPCVCYTSDLKEAGFCVATAVAYDWHLAWLDR